MKKAVVATGAAILATGCLTYASKITTRHKIYGSPIGRYMAAWASIIAVSESVLDSEKRSVAWDDSYRRDDNSDESIRICFSNVLLTNPYARLHCAEIAAESPDVVVMAETDSSIWDAYLQEYFPQHHYRHKTLPNTPGSGFHVISRLPITRVTPHSVGQNGRTYLSWKVCLPEKGWVTFIAVHPAAPITREWTEEWAMYLEDVTEKLPANGRLVVLGDFNATRHHGPFRKLLKASGGELVTRNVPTWPQNRYSYGKSGRLIEKVIANSRWLLPLDHAIVRGIPVVSVKVGIGLGSDHRPIHLEF